MNRLLRYFLFMGLALAFFPLANAEEEDVVTPPEGLPIEHWEMTYDDYRSIRDGYSGYLDLHQDIVIARDSNEFYMKGIFKWYPNYWIKCRVTADKIIVENRQILDYSSGKPIYFMSGFVYMDGDSGNTWASSYTEFEESEETFLDVSDDGNEMIPQVFSKYVSSYRKERSKNAFWYTDSKTDTSLKYGYWYWIHGFDLVLDPNSKGYPDTDFPTNIRFRKIPSGIGEISSETINGNNGLMYDLQGRAVNPENARPGIYIRDGKKILVK